MKILLVTVFMMISLIRGESQTGAKWRAWSVASHAKDSFSVFMKKIPKKATEEAADFIDLPAIVIHYQLGDTVFKNPLKEAGLTECQCAFDKDTLTIAMVEGYYAVGIFIAKIYKGLATSSFIAGSEDPDFRIGSGKWQKEIELSADKLELAVSKKAPFVRGETIYGIWKVDYPVYQLKEDENEIRNIWIKLKIYFSCRIEDTIQ